MVEARRSGRPGGHASVPQGLICDRKASDIAPVQLSWTAGTVEGVRRSGCPGDHASVPQRLICDRKASDLAPSLPSTTGSSECGLHVMVRQARDRQDPVEMSDLVPLRCDDKTIPIEIDETLMLINITGPDGLQRNIRLLCTEYIDIFSPTVRHEPARVPPLSMKVDSDKWKDKRNRLLPPRFLTRDKDADLRKQIALLETLGVIEKSTASKYSQVHLVRKPDHT